MIMIGYFDTDDRRHAYTTVEIMYYRKKDSLGYHNKIFQRAKEIVKDYVRHFNSFLK